MAREKQSSRLTAQHRESHGEIGIFGDEAKRHDVTVGDVSREIVRLLSVNYPTLTFRLRDSIEKKEINAALRLIDSQLGQTLFVENANIKPDGGIIEVKDDNGRWRVVLVSEAKYQGRWNAQDMCTVMYDVAETSLQVLACDLFKQLTDKTN